MDDIENVFYFVIIVVAIITKFISAKNAEKQEQEQRKNAEQEAEEQNSGRRVVINPDGSRTIIFDKPQVVEQKQADPETREETIQKALEEIKRRTEAERIEREQRRKREEELKRAQIKEKQKKYETKMSTLNTEEGVSSTGFKAASFIKKNEIEDEPMNVSLDITNMDEVRRAFIYSEIFERKY